VNVTFTLLVLIRLLAHRRWVRRELGPGYSHQYTSIAVILVESSALYAVIALLFAILLARNSPLASLSVAPMVQAQVIPMNASILALYSSMNAQMIGPLLIMYRVGQGKDWRSADVSPNLTHDELTVDNVFRARLASSDNRSSAMELGVRISRQVTESVDI
jgi:hypothetical protein